MLELPVDELIPGDESGAIDQEADRLRRREQLGLFGQRLAILFEEQVAQKAPIEERWLADLRQYAGEYDERTLGRIRETGGSEAFVNLTRVKCNSTEARLADMVLPTDDRNWAIEPTPVPELAQLKVPGVDKAAVAQAVQQVIEAAGRAAEAMQRQMDDQLQECGYNAVLRAVLHNAVVYGTGVLKGPVIRNRSKTRFARQPVGPDQGAQAWSIQVSEDLKPAAESVSPWDFFPDMRAARMDDAEFVFERHRLNKQRLRELAKLPGFIAEAIEQVLATEPPASFSGMVDQADSEAVRSTRKRGHYEVIEYTGPIDANDLVAAGVEVDTEDLLTTYQGTVWFVGGVVIKAALSMLDSGELMYDVMTLERDDTCIFGFGIPRLMHSSQRAGNAAWRMILDNARLTVGGQVIWKAGKIRPVNGDYRITSLKGWEVTDPNTSIADVFAVVPIASNVQGMFQIFETVRQLTDEETGLPMIAQGQQSPAVTKTAQGMSILMNSANTVLRRLVKEFDDSVTSRFIRRLYQWNMQYGEDENAKGDYDVIALGSSSLMVKEQQTQGLMQLGALAGSNPEFAQRMKWGDLLRTITRAMNINADGLVKSEQELENERAQAAQQPPQIPPEMQIEMAKLEVAKADLDIKRAKAQAEQQLAAAQAQASMAEAVAKSDAERQKIAADLQEARMAAQAHMAQAQAEMQRVMVERELAIMKIAAEREMTMEQVRKEFGIEAMKIDSAHQLANAEFAVKREMGTGI